MNIKLDKNILLAVGILALFVLGATAITQYSVVTSGVQGLSATWSRVEYLDKTYTPTDPTHFSFDPTTEYWPAPVFQDWVQYQCETDQPKFESTLQEIEAVKNLTDSKIYQYARLERWTLSVDLYAQSIGGLYSPPNVKFVLQLKTNPNAVFKDADDTTAYVVHAYVQEYDQLGTQHELVLPSQGAFSLYLQDSEVSPVPAEQYSSVIDLDRVRQFETVEIQFETSDFMVDGWLLSGYTDAHVHYVVALDVLVIGQWTVPLNENLGGENRAGGNSRVGWWDSMARGLGDFFSNIADWFSSFWWIIPIVLVSIAVLVLVVIIKTSVGRFT